MSVAATLASSITALALMNDGLTAMQKAKYDSAAETLVKAHQAAPTTLAPAGEYCRLIAAEAMLQKEASIQDGQALLKTAYRMATRDDIRVRAHELWVSQKGDPAALLPDTKIQDRYNNFRADAIAGALEKAESFLDGEVLESVRLVNRAMPVELNDGESMLTAAAKEMNDVECTVRQTDPILGTATVALIEKSNSQGIVFRARVVDGEWKADRVMFLGDESQSPVAGVQPEAKAETAAALAPVALSPEQTKAIDAAIQRLAARSPADRQSARTELIKQGVAALPQLEAASVSDDVEISESAKEVIRTIRP